MNIILKFHEKNKNISLGAKKNLNQVSHFSYGKTSNVQCMTILQNPTQHNQTKSCSKTMYYATNPTLYRIHTFFYAILKHSLQKYKKIYTTNNSKNVLDYPFF